MSAAVRFVFVLHDHQPVGNFDEVIEQAYRDSYLPFLDLFERHPGIRMALHTSGPLVEWLDRHHPEYLDRLARLAAAGRVEIVGGAFHEPVLAMLPGRDRIGQITSFTQWLERRFATKVSGMWVAERVWDPAMAADIAAAGIEWTILDDSHFKAAGLGEEELDRLWLTEGDGATLAVFPVSERLRYVIPFAAPHMTIDHLRWLASRRHGALAIFGDDGEKFGVWPDTHRACFEEGWLESFFTLLEQNSDWIEMALPSEVVRDTPPAGPVWLPECSYREMTEWVLPPEKQLACVAARVAAATDPALAKVAPFIRGGTWRNFRLRYPEANEMYARMLAVSTRLERLRRSGTADPASLAAATQALYRGQCNCAYWHGAFGGIYLPHLRNAIFKELIAAEKAADRAEGRRGEWVEATTADYDFDGRTDVRLANDQLDAWLAPAKGGMLYELDLRDQEHNLLATLDRRPEAYHEQVLAGPGVARSVVDASQLAKFKQEGLERMVRYDRSRRKSLVDHFWDCDVASEAVVDGTALERGDFASGAYEASIRRNPGRIQVLLSRAGNAWGIPFTLSKAVTLEAGSGAVEIAYKLEGLPPGFRQHLAVEFNFAGVPAGATGRFFYDELGRELGELGSRLDLPHARALGLVDDWLDIDARLSFGNASNGAATGVWTFPIQSVSQSEGGFELVHQSVVVMPHWIVTPAADGTWKVSLRLDLGRFSTRPRVGADRLAACPS
ncbi:MAG: alpha-amylase/4-alpha-glucanotransferase domain-containing protein [Planctomycetia bacterium]